jgi:hypothetical protein
MESSLFTIAGFEYKIKLNLKPILLTELNLELTKDINCLN